MSLKCSFEIQLAIVGDRKSRLYFDFLKTSENSEKQLSFTPFFVILKEDKLVQNSFHFKLLQIPLERKKKKTLNNLKRCQTKALEEVMVAFVDPVTSDLSFQ